MLFKEESGAGAATDMVNSLVKVSIHHMVVVKHLKPPEGGFYERDGRKTPLLA